MDIFKSDNSYEIYFKSLDDVISSINKYASEDDLRKVENIKKNFKVKVDDFFREDRKLNIGVVGQVKAGKSSFLNTLLFGGKEVLPKAATPKTATLTKMEYSDKNEIEIEYYSVEEWVTLEDNANIESDEDVFTSAREIMSMVANNGLDVREYLNKGTERISFDRYEDLVNDLNNYVGENGKYTPIIKSVTLYMNNKEFEGISIVDTPGLNDPIASRTIRTREFMEVCDVVFFLSQSGSFLDTSDWELLSSQLPQKGVKKLVLVASKYDSGIRDILKKKNKSDDYDEFDEFDEFDNYDDGNSTDNIPDACSIIRRKLRQRAKSKISEFVIELEKNGQNNLISVIKQCENPVLLSSICENMLSKNPSELNSEERNIYDALSYYSDDMSSDLKRIGNFEEIRLLFKDVVREKEAILNEKSKSFISTSKSEMKNTLIGLKNISENRIHILECGDKNSIQEQKMNVERNINSIKADILSVFSDVSSSLESGKIAGMREIREIMKDYNKMKERTGTEVHESSYTTGFLFWKRTHYRTYETKYSYYTAVDAIENIKNYSLDVCNKVERVFDDAIKIKSLKRNIFDVIVSNYDTGDENYDAGFYRAIVEESLAGIEFPVFKIDISGLISSIASNFKGEIRSSGKVSELAASLESAMNTVYNNIESKFLQEVKNTKNFFENMKGMLLNRMLENMNKEFELLLSQCENKDREIENYNKYISILSENIKKF